MNIKALFSAASVFFLLSFSASTSAQSLYQDLGELEGIDQLNERFVINLVEDRRISHHFEQTDLARLHQMLTEQFCELAGGPCVYSGDDMVTSHTGLNITRSDFNALVEALQLAMDDQGISIGAQNRLLALLAPMHHEVVNR